jgi:predicted membrane protein
MASLQKQALYTLIIGLIFVFALIVVFLLKGYVTAFSRDETLRWITYAALIGVPFTYLTLIYLICISQPSLMSRAGSQYRGLAGYSGWQLSSS